MLTRATLAPPTQCIHYALHHGSAGALAPPLDAVFSYLQRRHLAHHAHAGPRSAGGGGAAAVAAFGVSSPLWDVLCGTDFAGPSALKLHGDDGAALLGALHEEDEEGSGADADGDSDGGGDGEGGSGGAGDGAAGIAVADANAAPHRRASHRLAPHSAGPQARRAGAPPLVVAS